MREHQRLARRQVALDVAVIDLRLIGVGREHHDGVGPGSGIAHGAHLQSDRFGTLARAAFRMKPDRDADSAIAQVQRMGMALRSVPDNGDLGGSYPRKISVLVIKDLCHCVSSPAKNSLLK
jgi:hypothetical protein